MQVLYVMELLQNQDEGRACFSSISEFLLTHPVLSLASRLSVAAGYGTLRSCLLRRRMTVWGPVSCPGAGLYVGMWEVSRHRAGQGLNDPHCPFREFPWSWSLGIRSWCAYQALLCAH